MRRIAFAFLLLIAAPSFALAADDDGGPGACRAFGDKYCGGLQGPERRACLAAHADQLSASCKDRLATNGAGGGGGQARFAPCRDDLQNYCPNVQGADRAPCLQKNAARLSPACKQALPSLESD